MRAQVLSHDIVGEGPPVVLVPGGLTGWVSWISPTPSGEHACHIQNIDAFLKAFEDHIAHVSRSN